MEVSSPGLASFTPSLPWSGLCVCCLAWHDSGQGLWLHPRGGGGGGGEGGILSQPLRALVLAAGATMGKLTSRVPPADSELKRQSLKH